MQKFDSYKKDFGFEIGSGFSGQSDFMRKIDEKNDRVLMEGQYKFLQIQKEEIVSQRKYREEQRKGANFEKRLLIINTIIAVAALLVALFK